MQNHFIRFIEDESGATAIEYGLIAGLISVVIIGAVTTLGSNIKNAFQAIATSIPTSVGTGG